LLQLYHGTYPTPNVGPPPPPRPPTVSLRRSLESLQSCVGSCRVSHWLLRVLTAEDVRRGLEGGLAATRSALQQLVDAEGAADVVSDRSDVRLSGSGCV
jgi:hypothetical protein